MTAPDLDAILATLRAHGVASAEVPMNTYMAPLRVVFNPEPPPAGIETTPGGWKGPDRLDQDPFQIDERVP